MEVKNTTIGEYKVIVSKKGEGLSFNNFKNNRTSLRNGDIFFFIRGDIVNIPSIYGNEQFEVESCYEKILLLLGVNGEKFSIPYKFVCKDGEEKTLKAYFLRCKGARWTSINSNKIVEILQVDDARIKYNFEESGTQHDVDISFFLKNFRPYSE